tara:strand:+ start:181 stop:438 length:258 start_codon:yes stop_codon:yes gene_type:complete
MKTSKKEIKKNIILFLKKKKKKINFSDNKIDLIRDDIIDSIDFLNLISFLEKKLIIEIDLSREDPNIFSKVEKLSNSIYKNSKNK